ncbi:MAG TPA: type II toxin-antitoxin system Phd/YefM family antitoxin, partial [Bryobacteraceae bacterium]|nr:type II toxin-antitoxin system Phd/YefM family antitoxin [Bryobacteraceae bacterium]
VTEFQRNIKGCIGELKKKKAPMVLTVNGRAQLVVQDAVSYQHLLDRLAKAESLAAIRRGVADAEQGRLTPLNDVAGRLRSKHGL